MSSDPNIVKREEGDKTLTHSPRRLRLRRVAAGLSLTELAQQSGYSKGHLSMLEDGNHHGASAPCLRALAEALGCEITDLMPAEDVALMKAESAGTAA